MNILTVQYYWYIATPASFLFILLLVIFYRKFIKNQDNKKDQYNNNEIKKRKMKKSEWKKFYSEERKKIRITTCVNNAIRKIRKSDIAPDTEIKVVKIYENETYINMMIINVCTLTLKGVVVDIKTKKIIKMTRTSYLREEFYILDDILKNKNKGRYDYLNWISFPTER